MGFVRTETIGEMTSIELCSATIGRQWSVRCYLVGDILVDTGHAHMRQELLGLLRGRRLDTVLLTHHHEDHSGNARALQAARGISVYGHPLCVDKMSRPFRILPYQHYAWGATEPLEMKPLDGPVEASGTRLEPVFAPGHSKDMTVYLEPSRGWLFSGDVYLADRIKVFRVDERFAAQIDSLERVLELDFDALWCAHWPRPTNGKKHLRAKLQFLRDLYGDIERHWQKGMPARAVMHELRIKEEWGFFLLSVGNVSAANMVRAAIRDLES